jgi:hypothetical protein
VSIYDLTWITVVFAALLIGFIVGRARRKSAVYLRNEHGQPIYLEIHRGHRSGHLNFGVMSGLIQDFTLEQMQEFRQMLCVVIGISEEAFRFGNEKRWPTAQERKP